ncbi:hypothetical protein P692DRAFT_20847483 [Suillus brevipes Sb2]|nr:hypothetical protein P692DRAFT_20847483 [Suillus brevipes Sb2]
MFPHALTCHWFLSSSAYYFHFGRHSGVGTPSLPSLSSTTIIDQLPLIHIKNRFVSLRKILDSVVARGNRDILF